MIKNQTLIQKLSDTKNNIEYLLKKNNYSSYNGATRLGDVFSEMPSGLVYKEETGMGATTVFQIVF